MTEKLYVGREINSHLDSETHEPIGMADINYILTGYRGPDNAKTLEELADKIVEINREGDKEFINGAYPGSINPLICDSDEPTLSFEVYPLIDDHSAKLAYLVCSKLKKEEVFNYKGFKRISMEQDIFGNLHQIVC